MNADTTPLLDLVSFNREFPLLPSLDENSPFNGLLWEKTGFSFDAVCSADPLQVWTWIEDDASNHSYIVPGRRMVNRIGYFISHILRDHSDIRVYRVTPNKEETISFL